MKYFLHYIATVISIFFYSQSTFAAYKNVEIKGWIGPSASEILFNEPAEEMTLEIRNDLTCTTNDSLACPFISSEEISPIVLFSDSISLESPSKLTLKESLYSTDYIISNALPRQRYGFKTVVFKEKLWLFGGKDTEGNILKDVWFTEDGIRWVKVVDDPGFTTGIQYDVVVFKDKLYLVTGLLDGEYQSEIWVSSDGATWEEILPPAMPNGNPTALSVKNDRLWIFYARGDSTTGATWSSSDGSVWRDEGGTTNLIIEAGIVSFQNQFWTVGRTGDIFRLDENMNWLKVAETLCWTSPSSYEGPNMLVHDEELYVIAYGNSVLVCNSMDGSSWVKQSGVAGTYMSGGRAVSFNDKVSVVPSSYYYGSSNIYDFPNLLVKKYDHEKLKWSEDKGGTLKYWIDHAAYTVYKNELYIIAGLMGYSSSAKTNYYNVHTYTSPDALNWKGQQEDSGLSWRDPYFFEWKGELWMFGGHRNPKLVDGMFKSIDGVSWEVVDESLDFGLRTEAAFTIFNDKLWILGGHSEELGKVTNDVWSTSDGVSWTQVTDNAAFSPRRNSKLVNFGGYLWLFGDDENDLWRSADGSVWTLVTDQLFSEPRKDFSVVPFSGKMFVYGGSSETSGAYAKIWYSVNGFDWNEAPEVAQFGGVTNAKLQVMNGYLYLLNAEYATPQWHNNIWRSTDGFSWELGYADKFDVQTEEYDFSVEITENKQFSEITVDNNKIPRGTRADFIIDVDSNYGVASVLGCAGELTDHKLYGQYKFTTEPLYSSCSLEVVIEKVYFYINTDYNSSVYLPKQSARVKKGGSVDFPIQLTDSDHEIKESYGCNGKIIATNNELEFTYSVENVQADCTVAIIGGRIDETDNNLGPSISSDVSTASDESVEGSSSGGSFSIWVSIILLSILSSTRYLLRQRTELLGRI